MKKILATIKNIIYKTFKNQQFTTEEALLNNKVGRILMVISGMIWVGFFTVGLGTSLREFVKTTSNFVDVALNFFSVIFEAALHYVFYSKANRRYKELVSQQKIEKLEEKLEEMTRSNGKELKPCITKFLEQINKESFLIKYNKDVKMAIDVALSNKPTLITDFSKLEALLSETSLTDNEKLEVITFYYSKNIIFFKKYAGKDILIESDDKTTKIELSIEFANKSLYNLLKDGFEKANEYIDDEGNILPKKNELDEEDIAVINIQNQLKISASYIKAILKSANQKWRRQNKEQIKMDKIEEELKTKMTKIRANELEVTNLLVDHLIELMKLAKWDIKLIEETKRELMDKLQHRNSLREQDNIERDILRQKELQAANEIINKFIDINFNYEPLKFLNDDEIKQLEYALKTLGYKADKIMLIIKKVEIFNQTYLQELENEKCYQFLNQVFEAIESNDANFTASKSINIYNNAKTIIADSRVLDISLNYLKEQILFYVNFIDETIKANLEMSITSEIVNDIKESVIELDKIFNEIYEINNASKRQLIRFDELPN